MSFGEFLKLTPDELREQLSAQGVAPRDKFRAGFPMSFRTSTNRTDSRAVAIPSVLPDLVG